MSKFDAKAARSKRPLPLWVDAFQRDTALLETDEVGAYLKLLMAMWSSRTVSLPDDTRKLARAAGVSPRLWKSRIWPSLEGFFSICPDGLTQKRLREEAGYVERSVQAQSDRKTGATPESEAYASPQVTPEAPAESREKSAKSLEYNDTHQTGDKTTDYLRYHPTQQPNNPTLDGGGGSAGARDADPPEISPDLRGRILEACGVDPVSGITGPSGNRIGTQADMVEVARWRGDLGLTADQIVTEVADSMARKRDGPPKSLTYFRAPMERLAGRLQADPLKPAPLKAITGGRHERADHRHREDRAIDEYISRRAAGQIDLGPDPSDPFAGG